MTNPWKVCNPHVSEIRDCKIELRVHTIAIPHTSMMKESHIDGRSFLSATLLGG